MRLALPSLVACLLPLVSAFYPLPEYEPPPPESTSSDTRRFLTPRETYLDSLRIPLRKTPVKRDNIYNIISSTPPTQTDSIAVDQDGTDYSYIAAFKFGTDDQEYYLLLDSAAANTWVMSSDCTTDVCNMHSTFGTEDSSTLTTTQSTFSIAYGTGSVSGILATDKFHVSDELTCEMTFGLATTVSKDFRSYPMDGILGLGRTEESSTSIGTPGLMYVLADNGQIPKQLFGIHLSRTADDNPDGELNLGAPNPARYTGSLAWTDTMENTNGFWELPLEDAAVDGKSVTLEGSTTGSGFNRSGILDTGTSFILMPSADCAAFHSLIPGASLKSGSNEAYTLPCDTTAQLTFTFNGVAYNISHMDYVGHQVDSSDPSSCNSNIIGRQTFDRTQWLVGDVFLKNVYTVFDFDENRVGLGVVGTDVGALSAAETNGTVSAATTYSTATASDNGPIGTAIATSTSTLSATAAAASAGTSTAGASPSETGAASRLLGKGALMAAVGVALAVL